MPGENAGMFPGRDEKHLERDLIAVKLKFWR